MCDQLAHQSIVILECDDALVLVARNRLRELDLLADQPLDPETDRAGSNHERRYGNLSASLPAASRIRPREKSEDTSRAALVIAKIKVIGGGVVEVDRALDQTQAEHAGIEIEITLRVAGDPGDVMNAGRAEAHLAPGGLSPWRLALVGARSRTSAFAAVAALMLIGMRRNVFRVWLARARTRVSIALLGRGAAALANFFIRDLSGRFTFFIRDLPDLFTFFTRSHYISVYSAHHQ